MIRRRGAGTVAAILAAAALAGCSGEDGGSLGYVDGDSVVQDVAPDQRREPIELAGKTLDGKPLDIATLRGKPVVLNVWRSDCVPCRTEADELKAAATDLRPDGVTFVGINTGDQVARAQAFERTYKVAYPSVFDPGDLLLGLRGAVPPNAMPSTLVLDAKGRIAARVSGATTRRTVVGLVKDVLAEQQAS
jgi:peroxiredoxin